MNKYHVAVLVNVEVPAYSQSDAIEVIHDYFGEGETGDLNVTSFEVISTDES